MDRGADELGPAGLPQAVPVVDSTLLDPGTAGASARREYERRKAEGEARVRAEHPRLAGLILALGTERQSTKAWDTGALGEERLGNGLDRLASDHLRLLHDRRIPGSKANIDHLAVTAGGVYVIDAKKYRGRARSRSQASRLLPDF